MTIHKRTERKQEIVERTIIDGVECDLCKRSFPTAPEEGMLYVKGTDGLVPEIDMDEGINWKADPYHINATGLYRKEGNWYPEGGSYEKKVWHICPKCFDGKLIPWLESQGAEPTVDSRNC